ncbi:MAG: DUF308 domain-containing protein [Bacilli bacterium]|nr:DUF308 domain-containing protein [Bacilli bacterium]
MKQNLKELWENELVTNIVLLVVGIILTIWPDESLNVAVNLVGSVVVLFGIVNLVMWFMNKGNNYASLFIGILSFIVGIFIIVRSATVISIIHILLGIAVLADGITNMKTLMNIKSDSKSWMALFISSIITIILGILLIFKPLFIADMVTRIGGIVIILCALEGLLIMFRIKKAIK